MNPGKLDRRILILKEGSATGTYNNNEPVHKDAVFGYRWAMFEQVGENEIYDNEMLNVETRAKFTIRYDGETRTLNEHNKIKYNNKFYDIEQINPVEGRENYIEFVCRSTSITNFKT